MQETRILSMTLREKELLEINVFFSTVYLWLEMENGIRIGKWKMESGVLI